VPRRAPAVVARDAAKPATNAQVVPYLCVMLKSGRPRTWCQQDEGRGEQRTRTWPDRGRTNPKATVSRRGQVETYDLRGRDSTDSRASSTSGGRRIAPRTRRDDAPPP